MGNGKAAGENRFALRQAQDDGVGNNKESRGRRNGALGEIRTHDLCLRRAALYPLSYKRAMLFGAEGGI